MAQQKNILFLLFPIMAAIGALALWSSNSKISNSPINNPALNLLIEWNDHALACDRYTDGYNAPVAARSYSYIGLAAYQAALPAMNKNYDSLERLFPQLQLPKWDKKEQLYLPAALNACYTVIFDRLFFTSPKEILDTRQQIFQKWEHFCLKNIDKATYEQSKAFGEAVAMAVYDWSATDKFGHQANLHNFERTYQPTQTNGKWLPSHDFPMPSLLPYWGNTRTFLIEAKDFTAKPPPNYSVAPDSPYFIQALEVFTMSKPLSFENKWVAECWSDDHHGLTFSPAGRWVSITNQVIANEMPPIDKAIETYLRVGFAINDSFVACWHSKYTYNMERPETFIRKVFDPTWKPLDHTPPFPSYPSGHSMVGAAAATVLTNLYGENYEMTDNSHKGRTEFTSTPRHFHSFKEMANENAYSRIPLGVHFRRDCDEGLRLGSLIAKTQLQLIIDN
jgi:PAP2 superfamily